MKLKQLKRWKSKQKDFNQKYKLKSFKKPTHKKDYSGKYLFLISAKNLCTILKFLTNNSCVTETVMVVDDYFTKQMSKKILITSKHNKKLLKKQQCKVMVTKKYREEVMKIVKMSEPSQDEQKPIEKIAPIKILSCNFCSGKFTNLTALVQHFETIHNKTETASEGDNDDADEQETEILEDPPYVPIEPKIEINCDMVGKVHKVKNMMVNYRSLVF